jgi:hypothetical protein
MGNLDSKYVSTVRIGADDSSFHNEPSQTETSNEPSRQEQSQNATDDNEPSQTKISNETSLQEPSQNATDNEPSQTETGNEPSHHEASQIAAENEQSQTETGNESYHHEASLDATVSEQSQSSNQSAPTDMVHEQATDAIELIGEINDTTIKGNSSVIKKMADDQEVDSSKTVNESDVETRLLVSEKEGGDSNVSSGNEVSKETDGEHKSQNESEESLISRPEKETEILSSNGEARPRSESKQASHESNATAELKVPAKDVESEEVPVESDNKVPAKDGEGEAVAKPDSEVSRREKTPDCKQKSLVNLIFGCFGCLQKAK